MMIRELGLGLGLELGLGLVNGYINSPPKGGLKAVRPRGGETRQPLRRKAQKQVAHSAAQAAKNFLLRFVVV